MNKHTEAPHGTGAIVSLKHKEEHKDLGFLTLKEQRSLTVNLHHTCEQDKLKIQVVDKHKFYGSVTISLDWVYDREHFEDTKWVHIKDDIMHDDEISDGYTDDEKIEFKKL